jgi:hypothetical protein
MKRRNHLEDFICALSFQYNHYLENPVMLTCEHAACYNCIDDLRNNKKLDEVICINCYKKNSLKTDFKEDDLMKSYINAFSDIIKESVEQQYQETLQKAIGNNLR